MKHTGHLSIFNMIMSFMEEVMNTQKDIVEKTSDNVRRFVRFNELLLSPPDIKVGQTPSQIVYRKHKVKLIRYSPVREQIYKTPVLISYALVNKPYIVDLLPGRSIVEVLVNSGFDVYLIDWGTPTDSDSKNGLDTYINFYLDRMVDKVREISVSDKITLLGYCMGGTFSLLYTALHQEKIKNLILMATPFDCSKDEGILFKWAREMPVHEIAEKYGNCPGWLLASSFLALNPLGTLDKVTGFFKGVEDDKFVELFLAMEKWINDTVDVPGRAYTEFMTYCFQQNLLPQNRFVLGDKKVDLKKIKCPFLNIVAEQDTSVPPSSSLPVGEHISSKDKELLTTPAGHIGLSVSGKALKKLWPKAVEWMAKRS
ncbi:MAG: class III poly(R)-hydroxyalkanoic acid synthase subunit PhaC [Candidatus Eremiobacterota bacterium]